MKIKQIGRISFSLNIHKIKTMWVNVSEHYRQRKLIEATNQKD